MKASNQKFVALACAALLSACGGGGGGGGDPTTAGNTTGQTGGNTGTGTGGTGNSTNVYSTVEITDSEFDEFQTTGAALIRPRSSTSMSYTGDISDSGHTMLELGNGAFFLSPREDDTFREEVETDEEVALPYSYRYTVNEEAVDYYKDYNGVVIEHDGADRLETASNFLLRISQPLIPTNATHLELLYNGEVYKRNDITRYALWVHALEVNGL